MVQAKKFEQTFINEYLAWNLHDKDVEKRTKYAEKISIAKNLLSLNTPLDIIEKATGLSPLEIQQAQAAL